MRILIVEDEPKTREGLVKMINKFTTHDICGFAANGVEGIQLVKKVQPDLIISDIQMPEMDGLMMLRQLAAEKIEIPAIILTGYSSFEYARTALQLGVVEYALKPIDIESFMTVLAEVEEKILKEKLERISPAQLIWSIMTCEACQKEKMIDQLMKQLLINHRMEITMFLVKPSSLNLETAGEIVHFITDKLNALSIMNFQVIHLSFSFGILVLMIDTEKNKSLKRMFSTHILPGLLQIGMCQCSSTAIIGLQNIETALNELKTLLSYAFVFGCEAILDRQMIEQLQFSPIDYPVVLENRIRKEIINGDYEKAIKTSHQFKVMVIESNGKPELIKEFTARFASSVYGVAKEYNSYSEPLLLYHYLINDLIESKTKPELILNYEKVVRTILVAPEHLMDVDNMTVLKVINYIRDHYSENITLSEAASLVGVTPEYLSKLFNQIIHINFIVFLRDFRISVAKRMILSGKYQIKEVADHVGFNDAKYFNKVFKSVCGVSPSEYKKVI